MKKSVGLVFSLIFASVPMAHAGILGDSVGVEYQFDSAYHYLRFIGRDVVGSQGVNYSFQNLNILLTDKAIAFSFSAPMTFDASEALLSFRNRSADFDSSYRLVNASSSAGLLGPGAIFTDEHFLQINLTGKTFSTSDQFVLAAVPLPPVPEPAGSAMLAAGLGLIGCLMRRGRRARAA